MWMTTPIKTLDKAYDIGKRAGLKYIYLGNVAKSSDTLCYSCGMTVIERSLMGINKLNLVKSHCAFCNAKIKGMWE